MIRTALVTGANKGIGLAIARGLGEQGLRIIVGARDSERGQQAVDQLRSAEVDASFLPLDIADDDSVERAAAELGERYGVLDVLVNNAAIKLEFSPSPPSAATLDVVRQTYATNVFGTIAVTLAMLPLLRHSDAPRIVNMSSGLGSLSLASEPGSKYAKACLLSYNTSKTAINSITVQLANDLRDTAFKINAADPGYTNTDMTLGDGTRTPDEAAQIAIELATLPADGVTGGFFRQQRSPALVTRAAVLGYNPRRGANTEAADG